jgi:serine protease
MRLQRTLSLALSGALLCGAPQVAQALNPNDTLYASQQWWLGSGEGAGNGGVAGFARAWDLGTGAPVSGAGPIIAVLDSGVRDHPELRPRLVLPGYNFISKPEYSGNGAGRSNDPTDYGDALTSAEKAANPQLWDGCAVQASNTWHGSLIAGQLGAVSNNALGVAGINWQARILPVRVAGKCGAAAADVVDGMRWAAGLPVAGAPLNTQPARILVLGVAGEASCNPADPDANVAAAARAYVAAIQELRALGVLIVAPAGNIGGAVGRPANCPGVLAVTSLNRQGFKALAANFGPQVALAAPGGDMAAGKSCDAELADTGILSTSFKPDGSGVEYAAAGGTSFAAPQVAGAASLMWALNPGLSLAQVEAGLRLSARPHAQAAALGACTADGKARRCSCSTETCGAGMLDAYEALRYAQAPGNYAAPSRQALSLGGEALEACGVKQGTFQPTDPTPAPNPNPTPTPTPTPTPGPEPQSGGGGGSQSLLWSLVLALAGALLGRRRPA